MTIAALLLAAGESTRMGRLKQLLPWGGTTLIAWQVQQLLEAGAGEVVVVLGHEAELIRPAIPPTARVVINDAYKQGRATSVRCGALSLPDDVEAVLLLNVDQPRPAWASSLVIAAWRDGHPAIMQPRFAGRGGHPVLVDGSLLPELRMIEEETLGLRAVMERHGAETRVVSIANGLPNVDLNTPLEYERALISFERGEWSRNMQPENKMKAEG